MRVHGWWLLLLAMACGPMTPSPGDTEPVDAGPVDAGAEERPEAPADAGTLTDAGLEVPTDPIEDDADDAGEQLSLDDEDAGLPTDAGVVSVTVDAGVVDAGPAWHAPFRVMSYNVRGPFDTGAHSWDNRRADVLALIHRQSPDVLGVQEAMVTNGEDLPADLINGLSATWGSYRPAGGSPKIIFYKKSRFTRLAAGQVSLPNPYATSHVCFSRSNGKKLSWVRLRDRSTQREYFIANTHLAFSADCGLGRLRQAEEISRQLVTLAGALPVVLMGDFNTDDQAPELADEGVVEALETTGRRLFRTARHDGVTGPDDATFNSRWNGSGTNRVRLDYLFHSGGELSSSAPIVDRWPGTDTGTPSDHFPILATIRGAPFAPTSTLLEVNQGSSADTRLFFADVDGDGCADQLSWTSSDGTGATWWSRSSCQGTFSAPQPMGGATSGVSSTRFFFADVTGDGCADKVFWRPTFDQGNLRVYRGRCTGAFDPVSVTSVPPSTDEATVWAFARINGDACADLIRWNPSLQGGRLTVFPASCTGAVQFGAGVTGGAAHGAGTSWWFADVDGDGRDEALAWHPSVEGGKTRAFRPQTDLTFAPLFTHQAGSSGVATSRFFFADVTGDGRADKIFWRPTFRNGRAQIYPSEGTTFAPSPIMDNTGFSQSETTVFLYADTGGRGVADKVYWNPGANGGASKCFRAYGAR